MAVDRNQLSRDLSRFYDFTGKTVVYVGAGNGQLLNTAGIGYLVAIDEDPRRADKLRTSLTGGPGFVEVIAARFEDVRAHGDVVYFEFCLHEMKDPQQALEHARELAPELIVFDHSAGSEWSFYAAEDEKSGAAPTRYSSSEFDGENSSSRSSAFVTTPSSRQNCCRRARYQRNGREDLPGRPIS